MEKQIAPDVVHSDKKNYKNKSRGCVRCHVQRIITRGVNGQKTAGAAAPAGQGWYKDDGGAGASRVDESACYAATAGLANAAYGEHPSLFTATKTITKT